MDARIDLTTGRCQSLPCHVRNVAKLCGSYAAAFGLVSVGHLIGLLHDFGKARRSFQTYLHERDEGKNRALRGKINHSAAGAQWLLLEFGGKNDPFERLLLEISLLVICGHHSGLPDCLSTDGKDALSERVKPQADIELKECEQNFFPACATKEEIAALWKQGALEIQQIYQQIVSCNNTPNSDTAQFAVGLIVRYLSSCLIDADRYDAFCFATAQLPVETELSATFWNDMHARLEKRLQQFSQNTPLARLRREISDICQTAGSRPAGVYRLLAPTGSGKTLSSLRFALQHALLRKERPVKRIFYIIPYTTILDQTAEEIRKALGDEPFILEHHSSVLPDESSSAEELETRELYLERWNAPIILTTMVQFLNTLFAGRNGCARRMHQLADAVLIFDEIQALPLKCTYLFNAACHFLSALGGTTVALCTATQPALTELKVPLLLSPQPEILPHHYADHPLFQRVRIVDTRLEAGAFTTAQLAEFILSRAAENPSLLTILNTKSAAKRLYLTLREQLPADWALYHLSTNMCAAHRLAVLEAIKKEKRAHKLCVSTQLIEAGIDISFACVVRSLAGLDSIAQAAGRCNRHGEFPSPRCVYIIENQAEELSLLPDIRHAQTQARCLLACAEELDNRFLSPKAIAQYYRFYYNADGEKKMSYPILKTKDFKLLEDSSVFALLSHNKAGWNAFHEISSQERSFPWLLKQAFAFAGRHFIPIEKQTTTVLVPYGEGKQLLSNLSEPALLPDELAKYLRQAQQYTVNLFEHEIRALRGKDAITHLPCGALALSEAFYSDEYGVIC